MLTWFPFPPSSVDIPFSEGPVNLNWAAIMKTVNEDPYEFFREGGWSFLAAKDDVCQGGLSFGSVLIRFAFTQEPGSSDESTDGSEFNASDDAAVSSEEDSASDFDEDASDDSGSDDDDAAASSGEDWSDAEDRLAKKEVEKKVNGKSRNDSGSESDRPKKSKSKSKNR